MKRKAVAFAVLLMLLALIVVAQPGAVANLSGVTAIHSGTSAWAYSVGMSRGEGLIYSIAATVACGSISGPGGIACGIVAAG
jgi:hypothetical protein